MSWRQALAIFADFNHPDAEQVRERLGRLANTTRENTTADGSTGSANGPVGVVNGHLCGTNGHTDAADRSDTVDGPPEAHARSAARRRTA